MKTLAMNVFLGLFLTAAFATTSFAFVAANRVPFNPELVKGLIEQLDGKNEADRKASAERLFAGGMPVVPLLTEAALRENREPLPVILILKRFYEGTDLRAKKAAGAALQQIAASKHEDASKLAKKILEPKEDQPLIGVFGTGPAGDIVVAPPLPPGVPKTAARINNGIREIRVEEADRKILIKEDPGRLITMEVTTTKDGKSTTASITAKNAEELKKKFPAAFKVYDHWNSMQGWNSDPPPAAQP